MRSWTAEEWEAFLEEQQNTLREIEDYVAAVAQGDPELWQRETSPLDNAVETVDRLLDAIGSRPELGDYSLSHDSEAELLTIRHFGGVEQGILCYGDRPWLKAEIMGSTVFVTERGIELEFNPEIVLHWRRMLWASGQLEPHRKGDLIFVEGFGAQRWRDDMGTEIVEDRPVYYNPSSYKGYASSQPRICRGQPVESSIFVESLKGLYHLPGTTNFELTINYDQWVERVLEQSGLKGLLKQANLVTAT